MTALVHAAVLPREREMEAPEHLAKYLAHIGQGGLLTHAEETSSPVCTRYL